MSHIDGIVFNKSIFESRFRFDNDSIPASKKKGVRCHNALTACILRIVRKPPIKLEVYVEGKKTFIHVNRRSLIQWFEAHNQKLNGLTQWNKKMWQSKVEQCLKTIDSQKKITSKKQTTEEPKKPSIKKTSSEKMEEVMTERPKSLGVEEEVIPDTQVLKGKALINAMHRIDRKFTKLCSCFQEITKDYSNFRSKIPPLLIDVGEQAKNDIAQNTVKELENYLIKKYSSDMDTQATWHGRLSLQRIVWQDEKFLEAISDTHVVKAMLINAKEGKEAVIGKGLGDIYLSSSLLFGPGLNRLSYLVTTAPNWSRVPPQGEWKDFNALKFLGNNREEEIPWEITESYLSKLEKGLQTLQNVIVNHTLTEVPTSFDYSLPIHSVIEKSSMGRLLELFDKLIKDDNKIKMLMGTGHATQPQLMTAQCLEIMSGYPSLLKLDGEDHSKVLGRALISHALDARHLASTLYVLRHPESLYFKQLAHDPNLEEKFHTKMFLHNPEEFKPALEQFGIWFKDIVEGKFGETAAYLMKIRLQQVLKTIVDNRDTIGLSLDSLEDAVTTLAPEIEPPKTIILEKNASESIPEDILNIIVSQLPLKEQLSYTQTHKKWTPSKQIASAKLLKTGKIKDKDQIIRLACAAGEKLKSLNLEGMKITSEDLAAIATHCTNVTFLNLNNVDLTWIDVKFPPRLKTVYLKFQTLTSEIIKALPKSIVSLNIAYTISPESDLLKFLPTGIKSLVANNSTIITNQELKHLSRLEKLEILNVGNNTFITNEALVYLPKNINQLFINQCDGITREGVEKLRFTHPCKVSYHPTEPPLKLPAKE